MAIVADNRRLAGQTKQYLDDLLTLNTKTTAEMVRGIRENYLDTEGAIELAKKLNVEPPRVKRAFTFFFTKTEIFSIRVNAYDEDQGEREAERLLGINAAAGEVYHGARSRFTTEEGRIRRFFSTLMRQRPQSTDTTFPPHPLSVQLAEADVAGNYSDVSFALRRDTERVQPDPALRGDGLNL